MRQMLPARQVFREVLSQVQTVVVGTPLHEIVRSTLLASTVPAYARQNAGHQPRMKERLDLIW